MSFSKLHFLERHSHLQSSLSQSRLQLFPQFHLELEDPKSNAQRLQKTSARIVMAKMVGVNPVLPLAACVKKIARLVMTSPIARLKIAREKQMRNVQL
jgi:hypothetical protein